MSIIDLFWKRFSQNREVRYIVENEQGKPEIYQSSEDNPPEQFLAGPFKKPEEARQKLVELALEMKEKREKAPVEEVETPVEKLQHPLEHDWEYRVSQIWRTSQQVYKNISEAGLISLVYEGASADLGLMEESVSKRYKHDANIFLDWELKNNPKMFETVVRGIIREHVEAKERR